MTNYLRQNAWDANNDGQFEDQSGNPTQLYWYAKAVQIMQSRPIEDPSSWWFYGAIHGEYLITTPPQSYLRWKNIHYIQPSANLDTLPSQSQSDLFWNQCQHGTWFFPPWHRGYLVALENLLRDIIVNELDGPSDWALPYWNYLNQSTKNEEYKMPPAFSIATLPDGTNNPLYVPERYGPDGDSVIYIPVGPINDKCQWDTAFSESSDTGSPRSQNLNGYYYGGKETGFNHSEGGTGDLEMNPHNFVHGKIGGRSNQNGQTGLMGVVATAALDPIFYLHHANIDRMWAAWNETGKNKNVNEGYSPWLEGPTADGNSRFAMPLDSGGTPWYFTPDEVQNTNKLTFNAAPYSYTYDDLSLTSYDNTPPSLSPTNVLSRLTKLGVTNINESAKIVQMANKKESELIGASSSSIKLNNNAKTQAVVKLNAPVVNLVEKSFRAASVSNIPDDVFLQLEDVKGVDDSNFLSVYLNKKLVNTISLFGLQQASLKNGAHGGTGMTFKFNISHLMDDLHLDGSMNVDSMDVQIESENHILDDDEITIGRISIYRTSQ